jgi:hypothetical protein
VATKQTEETRQEAFDFLEAMVMGQMTGSSVFHSFLLTVLIVTEPAFWWV